MRTIIAGSRNITNYSLLVNVIDHLIIKEGLEITQIISGGANGVDKLAIQYANDHNIPLKVIKPAWDDITKSDAVVKINRFGKKYNAKAGMDRNEEMAKVSDALIALWDGKSRGTLDMIQRAKRHNLVVFAYRFSSKENKLYTIPLV